jgi:hypothetical protein
VENSVVTTTPDTLARKNAAGMTGWMKFIGILNIIAGAVNALTIIGILWAWLPIWLGVVLTQAGSRAREYADKGDMASLEAMTGRLKTYFTLSGVVMIVSIALGVIAAIFWGVVVAMGLLPSWQHILDQLHS